VSHCSSPNYTFKYYFLLCQFYLLLIRRRKKENLTKKMIKLEKRMFRSESAHEYISLFFLLLSLKDSQSDELRLVFLCSD